MRRDSQHRLKHMADPITYEQIFQETSNGVVVTDHAGVIVLMNRQAEIILDAEAKDQIGRFVVDFLPLSGTQVINCLNSGKPLLGHHVLGKRSIWCSTSA